LTTITFGGKRNLFLTVFPIVTAEMYMDAESSTSLFSSVLYVAAQTYIHSNGVCNTWGFDGGRRYSEVDGSRDVTMMKSEADTILNLNDSSNI
jgi:hypothetical protein